MSLEGQIRQLMDLRLCKICIDKDTFIIMLPSVMLDVDIFVVERIVLPLWKSVQYVGSSWKELPILDFHGYCVC